MKKKLLIVGVVFFAGVGLAFFLWKPMGLRVPVMPAAGAAQAEGPQIILYFGENFTGRSVTLVNTAFDLPTEEERDGSLFTWNDQVRSLVVVSGTWRLYQNGRLNTRLDGTRLDQFSLQGRLPDQGWSALVSGTSAGRLEVPDVAEAGIGVDISSIELVSTQNLPDWALVLRKQ